MKLLIFHANPLSGSAKTVFRFCQSSWVGFLSDFGNAIILAKESSDSLFTPFFNADNMSAIEAIFRLYRY